MAYSEFTLESVREMLNLSIDERQNLFADIQPVSPSNLLTMILDEYLSLAIDVNSEKARSEFIIAPILGDIRRQSDYEVSLFSGKEFNVDREKGLTGYCDFILCLAKEQLYIQAPVMTILEAKNENIVGGLGQCIASMVAAQIFNQKHGNRASQVNEIYGAVTTGTNWRFLKLNHQTVSIDKTEYYIRDIDKILGILMYPRVRYLEAIA
ncbi:MAG: hypothetical protein F6K09_31075 [Merismopedia sp. SIO2A8]|nr:hypothetical protein [Merismopedia sp. SIO2A8]